MITISPKICKRCGHEELSLVPRNGMGVCSKCANDIDAQTAMREHAVIALLREQRPRRFGLTEIQTLLEQQNIKVAISSLHDLVMRLVENKSISRVGPYYFVEESK